MAQQQGSPQFASLPHEVAVNAHRFDGQVAIIHGGAQGLGRVAGRRLALEGASIVIADIQEEQGTQTASDISEAGCSCIVFILRVADHFLFPQ